jgi:hypothetical protein
MAAGVNVGLLRRDLLEKRLNLELSQNLRVTFCAQQVLWVQFDKVTIGIDLPKFLRYMYKECNQLTVYEMDSPARPSRGVDEWVAMFSNIACQYRC